MEYSTPPTISGHHEAVEGRVRAAALGRSSPGVLVGPTAAASQPVTFPNEIFDIIFSNVGDNSTLYSLGRCCRAFTLLAEPRLYSSLKFTPGSKTIKQARTLVQNPRKSTYVTTIVAELLDVEYILLPAGLKLVITAIVGCPNLRSLSTSWRTEHNWSTGNLLSTRFRLYDFTTWFQWDNRVRQFLETQPSIQELKIVRPGPDYAWGGSPEPDLPPPALPLLSNLEARLPQALAIVPGRPVSSLSLYGAVTLTNLEAALPSLARSTVPLESLSLQAGELSSDLLTLINAYLPSISRFELRIVRFSMVAYSDLTSESLRQAMALMTYLCYFRLRLRCPYLFKDPFYHTQRDVILEWKYHCPSLRKVVFESSSENKTPEWTFDEEAMDWMCSLDDHGHHQSGGASSDTDIRSFAPHLHRPQRHLGSAGLIEPCIESSGKLVQASNLDMSPLLTPPMSNRPSEKENVPFAQPPSSPKKLLDAFQLSPRTPRSSPQRSTKCSPRPPVSPRSSPNRSRGHLRSTLNLHPPSLLTKTRSHRVSFAQRDSHHLYTTPLRALPSYSSRPAAFIAARSILKSRTPERVVVPDPEESVEGAAPKLNKREMSPVPDDPLRCPTYLSSPVSTIVGSVSITPSPNRIDSDMMDVCGPLPMSLHDLAEAYTLLLARLRLQAMTVGPDGVATDTEITPELPLLQPIQQHHSDLATALARDVARALVKPVSFTAPTPYQPLDVDDWSSDYSSDVYGSSSPPGSPSGPTQKRGLTAAEVKYARDLSLVSQSAIRVLAVVFHEPAVSSHFTDDELIEMLKVLISIPNTMPLPTPNPRKTHTAALWALQMIRLPLSIMHSPGVVDSLFVALQMAVQGKLGREGKKGSTSEGLTAVQLLTSHYPSIFGPMLPILMSDLVKCLSSPMPIIRQRAALALGGIVQGLFDWEEEEEVSAADSKKPLDLSAVHAARKEISEALLDTFDLEKNAKNAMLLKNVKDILSQFSPEASVIGVRAGDTPHWAFSVLASLVTLLERNFFACNALHTSVLTCGRIALNAKKAAIRTAGGLLWGCVVWAWKRYDAQDESRGESEESMKNEKIMAQVVVENIGFGVVAALLETKDRSEVVATRRLRRVCRCVKSMVEERCWGAPELLGRLLSTEESPSASATPAAIERKLVPTSLLTQQLAGADLKALAIAVNSCVSQGVKPEEVRPLTMDERVAEWPQLFSTWKHFPGWIPTTDEGEPAEVLLQTWRALLLATTNVQDHIPCFVAIAEALTAFANSKHEDPKQTALTLTFVRRLWLIVHEVFFNPLSSNTLLADFSADLIQTLAQRPPELGKKVVRESWVTLLAEVLASGTLDSTETLCDVLPESLWGSVYAGVVNKYAEDPNFEGGLVLCGVPFNESYAWVLSEDDWNAWSSLAHAMVVSEGEQVFSNLLTMIGTGQTIPIPSTLRPLSILLSFSELPVSESDGVFSNLLNMANDRLRAEYSSCLSPETLEAVLDLISALRGIITPDAMCLEVIESVQSGMQLWIEDEQFALSDQEFNDGPVLFYAHAMQGLTAVPDELLDLGKLAPFLASAFTRIPPPGAGPLAFSLFWNQKFAGRGPPEGGYPEILKPCLRGILNIEELIEGGISLGTDIGEETQPKDLPASGTTVDDNAGIAGDSTSAKSAEQPGASSEVANTSIESVEMADATNQSDDTRTEEETVESSVEEIDELLDDSDIVEETIVYEPPSRPDSPSSLVPARASTPIPRPAQLEAQPQAEPQSVPDSQVETTETAAEDSRAECAAVLVCESPRKRKYEAATLPSKRPKGLFVADPEIESLPILRFPARSRSSSPGSVVEESIFYSPDKHNVPAPAWSPTGVSQLLPALPVAEPVSAPAEETVEISLSEVIETSTKDSVDEPAETSVDDSANTSVDESANTSIDDLPDNDLNDLPDITMSLPIRKKRMTFVVEVPRVSEVLKRWSSDSATAKSVPATTPRKKKPGMPERVRRTRSWSKLPQMAAVPPELESTPLRRPLKRRRSDRDSSGELSIELGRSRKNSRSSTSSGDLTITPKQLLTADMFDGASPDDTPSLRRVRSMPLSAKKATVGSVGRAASLAASKASAESTSESFKNTASAAQVENEISVENGDIATTTTSTPTLAATATTDTSQTSTTEPVTRTASLEALMADADTLAKLDVAELMRQEEMLAAMKEQVARALAMKRAASVVSNTGRDFSF